MKFSKNILPLFFILITLFSCQKEENIIYDRSNIQPLTIDGLTQLSDQVLIQFVRDSIANSMFKDLTINAGHPQWDCAYVILQDSGSHKIVVPYKSGNFNSIENLLIAYRSPLNTWRVKIINKYYYEFMSLISEYDANRLVFKAFLNEFETAESICNPTSSINVITQLRTKMLECTIVFDDGTIWWLYTDGSIDVTPGASSANGEGCFNGNKGTITWNNGSTYSFPNNNSSSNGSTSTNWNNNENSPGCTWCNSTQGGGGGGSSNIIPACQASNFWANYPDIVKKEYVQYLSNMLKNTDIISCTKPNITEQEKTNCFTNTELLCMGVENGCIQVVNGHLDFEGFTDCMGAVLHRLPCMNVAENFLNEYGLNMSVVQLEQLAGGFSGNCSNQEDFDEYVVTNIANSTTQWPNPIVYNIIWNYIKKKWNKRNSPYNQSNQCEKNLMLQHPQCASSIGANWLAVNLLTKATMGANGHNDCSDAFRHAFFNAMNSIFCGIDVAREFGIARECDSKQNKETQMDLHNNAVGFSVIADNPNLVNMINQSYNASLYHLGIQQLINLLCTKMSNGDLLVFKIPSESLPDNNPNNILIPSLDCSCIN